MPLLNGGRELAPGADFRFKTLGCFVEPVVEVFEAERQLAWSAKGLAGTSGAHAWHLEKTAGGCRVVTEEAQTGALLLLPGWRVRADIFRNHQEWLRALAVLAEGQGA